MLTTMSERPPNTRSTRPRGFTVTSVAPELPSVIFFTCSPASRILSTGVSMPLIWVCRRNTISGAFSTQPLTGAAISENPASSSATSASGTPIATGSAPMPRLARRRLSGANM